MICVRFARSAPDRAAERATHLEAHKAFLRSGRLRIIRSGPIHDEGGGQVGAMVVADMPSLDDMRSACADDPFAVHGVYADVSFVEWRVSFGDAELPLSGS